MGDGERVRDIRFPYAFGGTVEVRCFSAFRMVLGGLPVLPKPVANSSSLSRRPPRRLLSTDEDLEELREPFLEFTLEEVLLFCCCCLFFLFIYSVGSNRLNGGAELDLDRAGDADLVRLPEL